MEVTAMDNFFIEVCANSTFSAIQAEKAGADRIELCAGIPEGGTTPSWGTIATTRAEIKKCKINVIIRPRGGDFLYSELEKQIMLKDIEAAKKAKVDGVVIGALNRDGSIDVETTKQLIEAAEGLTVTFHRAFDMCKDPTIALVELIQLKCDFLLTSGQANSAEEGIPLLKKLQEQAKGRIKIIAGCGVNANNIKTIAEKTDINEFHFSAKTTTPSMMSYRNPKVSMGNKFIDEYLVEYSSQEKIIAVKEQLKLLR